MAAEYHLVATPAEGVMRASDGKWISNDADAPNQDWLDYQEWLAAGNVPDPAYTPPEETAPPDGTDGEGQNGDEQTGGARSHHRGRRASHE